MNVKIFESYSNNWDESTMNWSNSIGYNNSINSSNSYYFNTTSPCWYGMYGI